MRLPLQVRALLMGVATSATLCAAPASAAPCVGFVDVDDSSQFCSNVEWIKNRVITLGCVAGAYCPTDPVTRAAMAFFLQRFGTALVPFERQGLIQGLTSLDPDANAVWCANAPTTVANYARLAHGSVYLTAQAPAAADITAQFVESTDGGATWIAVSTAQAMTVKGDSTTSSMTVILPPRDLQVGTQYSHGLRIGRLAGSSTTGDLLDPKCVLRVYWDNRNPATPPLDEDD